MEAQNKYSHVLLLFIMQITMIFSVDLLDLIISMITFFFLIKHNEIERISLTIKIRDQFHHVVWKTVHHFSSTCRNNAGLFFLEK